MSPQTSRRHARSVARAMCWMLVADVVCCIAIVGWSRNQAYEAEMRQGTVAGLHLVQAATDHADSTLNMVAWTLDSVADRVETDGVTGAAADRLRQFLLSRVQQKDSPLEGLLVSDASGRWAIATGLEPGASDFGTVTISAGVATAIPAPGDEARMLVEKADAALYQAKEAGRNTVR